MPDLIIRNRNITSIDFVILLYFKYLYFINGKGVLFQVELQHMKNDIMINDNRTIKKSFENLFQLGFINKIIIKQNNPLDVELNVELLSTEPYTRLPTSIINNISKIGHTGVRLLYYYESYINRRKSNSFCFASFKTIESETGITDKTISKYNSVLIDNKLIKIIRHEIETYSDYKENSGQKFDKYNNHYYVNIERI